MPQISKRFLDRKVEKKIKSLLPRCVSRCRDIQIASDFIDDLLTGTEKTMIAKRIAIALMLLKEYSVSQIEDTLKVSRTTVYTVATWLQLKGTGYRSLLQKIIKEDKEQEDEHKQAFWELENTTPRWGTNWKANRKSKWKKLESTKTPF